MQGSSDSTKKRRLPHINFRPLLFAAFGFAFGVFLYFRIRFGGFAVTDLLFSAALFTFALFPLTVRRVAILAACFLLFAGIGAACAHFYTLYYSAGEEGGEYTVEGTVCEFTPRGNYTVVVLTSLSFDGTPVQGKLRASVVADARPADIVRLMAKVGRVAFPENEEQTYAFTENIRYEADASNAEIVGRSNNFLLRLNADIYGTLEANAGRDEGALCYAVLTGNAGLLDGDVADAARFGGIAHIFAVSGLHIGIFYGAVMFLCKPLKRYAFLPACALALLYAGVCGFSVSALRAVLMCFTHGTVRFFRRKTDFLNALSAAALAVLFLFPAQWLAAGFRLSFGACLGIALFANTASRGLRRLHIPRSVAGYAAASLSVQIFTFPILLETFGYASFWGILLNLVFIPFLPLVYLTFLLPVLFALVIPPAGAVIKVANASASLLLYLVTAADLSFVLTGFTLGAGGVLWGTGCVFFSERFRMPRMARLSLSCLACLLLAAILLVRNVVFTGCKVTVYDRGGGVAALVQTTGSAVLVIDDEILAGGCNALLARSYAGTLDAVIVVGEDAVRGINTAAFLKTRRICALREVETGLRERELFFGETHAFAGLSFRYVGENRLVLFAEGTVVEFSFGGKAALAPDVAVEKGNGDLKFFLDRGIIYSL